MVVLLGGATSAEGLAISTVILYGLGAPACHLHGTTSEREAGGRGTQLTRDHWRDRVDQYASRPVTLRRLFRFEQTSGVLMIAAMLLALAVANSPAEPLYRAIHHAPVHLRAGPLVIDEPLVQWINEGLMVFFFLLVGLEIKRQLLEGHLSTPRHAAMPALAALGGMVMPASVYALFNAQEPELSGWAIPTATDIVLALGILSLLGRRVPASLKVFLTALAIFDDIGAVVIIGLFYGEGLALVPLALAAASVAALVLLNVRTVTAPAAYVLVGLILWIAMLKSGMEAALAGVLIGASVPLRAPGRACSSPLRATERRLHPFGTLAVVPLFAFFNAGIALDAAAAGALTSPVSLGVALGLFLGKPAGILAAAWISARLRLAELPKGVGWAELRGVAVLAGIGFTMSLFVAPLAFADPALVATAKTAILVGSALSSVVGLSLLHASLHHPGR